MRKVQFMEKITYEFQSFFLGKWNVFKILSLTPMYTKDLAELRIIFLGVLNVNK